MQANGRCITEKPDAGLKKFHSCLQRALFTVNSTSNYIHITPHLCSAQPMLGLPGWHSASEPGDVVCILLPAAISCHHNSCLWNSSKQLLLLQSRLLLLLPRRGLRHLQPGRTRVSCRAHCLFVSPHSTCNATAHLLSAPQTNRRSGSCTLDRQLVGCLVGRIVARPATQQQHHSRSTQPLSWC